MPFVTNVLCRDHPRLCGNNLTGSPLGPISWDHPRLCGNNAVDVRIRSADVGSPPPVREQQYSDYIRGIEDRITPACAGTTSNSNCFLMLLQDHPRLCGNNSHALILLSSVGGITPACAGTTMCLGVTFFDAGITPACAGTTVFDISTALSIKDHPRLCGNNCTEEKNETTATGSPPPVREQRSTKGLSA